MGGSSSPTTVETVPEWLKPYLTNITQEGQDLYGAGAFSHVEGLTGEQQEGMGLLKGAVAGQMDTANKSAQARDVMLNSSQGKEIVGYDNVNTQAIKDAAIRKTQQAFGGVAGEMAANGLVGGRRAELVKAQRDAEMTSQLANIDYNDYNTRRSQALSSAGGAIQAGANVQQQAMAPGTNLTNVGKGLQEQNQRQADGTYQGYSRWLSALQGVPTSPNQPVTGGK